MIENKPQIAKQLADSASRFQAQRTGHAPKAVTVVLSEETMVVTLHEALTPAERQLSQSVAGAAQVQEFHRQLFASTIDEMREEILRLTGRKVREAVAQIDAVTGAVIQAFTTGDMVQVYLLDSAAPPEIADNWSPPV